jgi:hypothetical protein
MELENVNPNGDNVATSNPINIKLFFLKIVKIEFKNKNYMLFSFFEKCHDCPKYKIPHIVHLIN